MVSDWWEYQSVTYLQDTWVLDLQVNKIVSTFQKHEMHEGQVFIYLLHNSLPFSQCDEGVKFKKVDYTITISVHLLE